MIIECLVAFAILSTVAALTLAHLHRMDENLARTRCEAHLGMLVNQYTELFSKLPYDAIPDAVNSPSSGYILFGGGTQDATEMPYRVAVSATYAGRAIYPRSQSTQVVVDVYWSPPDPSQENALMPTAGDEKEFRQVVINRTRF